MAKPRISGSREKNIAKKNCLMHNDYTSFHKKNGVFLIAYLVG
tara:strand:- start:1171 stop:1299 length:129 start_codon:yes stop_codon:yes gene_type:complete